MLYSPSAGKSRQRPHESVGLPGQLIAATPDRLAWLKRLLTIALAATAILYVTRTIDVFPLGHDVTVLNSTGDDWLIYHWNAMSVVNDGLAMPRVKDGYTRPAGFGYVYFIAAIYAVAGVRSEVVYLIQGLLLIAGIAGMYSVFRTRFSALGALAFVLVLAIFMYVDVYRALTFRLLSENLLFPLVPALLYFVIKGESTSKLRYFAIGGVVCGLCFLARPNAVLLAPAAAAVVLWFKSARSFSWRASTAIALLAACAAVASLLPLRNYVVTGRASVAAVTDRSDWSGDRFRRRLEQLPPGQRVVARATRAAGRVAYLIGIPQFMRPGFRLRPHWLAMWGAFGWYLFTLVRRKPEFWEVLILALAVAYFVPIVQYGAIASYGFRMLTPGVPLILVLAARGLEARVRGS